jgi:hypothetical protein
MMNEQITLRATDARRARSSVRRRLTEYGAAREHVIAVEAVVGEFLATCNEAGLVGHAHLIIETFPLLTSVRLRCSRDVTITDDPFGLRARVLERLTTTSGKRTNADGTTDLFAEVPRRMD